MFKKLIALVLSVLMIFSISGCGKKDNKDSFKVDANDFNMNFGTSSNDISEDTDNDYVDDTVESNNNVKDNSSKKNDSNVSKVTSSEVVSNNNSSKTSSKVTLDIPTVSTENSTTENKPQSSRSVDLPTYENTYKLSNSLNILKSGETLKVVYYGGSVTSGTGSKDAEKKSWRALTDVYLKTYGNVKSVNKAVGGTGSYLGISRFENDVIAEDPDLLFIEFAINDGYSGLSAEVSVKDVEYMIRRLNEHNPNADIVICFITNQSTFGEKYERYVAQKELADHYGIPCIDLGGGLYNKIEGAKNKWSDYFADSVHPNDKGHSVYAEVVQDALKQLMVSGNTSGHSLPAFKSNNGWSKVSVLKVDSSNELKVDKIGENLWGISSYFSNDDYEKTGSQLRTSQIVKSHFKSYLYPKTDNSSFTFNFKGNSLGMIGTIKEGCTLTATLENGETVTLTGTSKDELIEYLLFSDIENKEHTVTISVSGKPPYITIAALIVTE